MSKTKNSLIVPEKIETTSLAVVQEGLKAAITKIQAAVTPEKEKLDAMDINDDSTITAINSLTRKIGISKMAIKRAVEARIKELEGEFKGFKAELKQFVADVDAITASVKARAVERKAAQEAQVAAHQEKLAEIEKFKTAVEDGGVITSTLSLSIIDNLVAQLTALEITGDEYLSSDLMQKKLSALDWLDGFRKKRKLEIDAQEHAQRNAKLQELKTFVTPVSAGGKLATNMSKEDLQYLEGQLKNHEINQDSFGDDLIDEALRIRKQALLEIQQLKQAALIKEQKDNASQVVVDLLDKIKNSSNLQEAYSSEHAKQLLAEIQDQKKFLLSVQPSEYGDSAIAIQSQVSKALSALENHHFLIINQGKQFVAEQRRQEATQLLDRISHVPVPTVDNISSAISSIQQNKETLQIIANQAKAKLSKLSKQLIEAKLQAAEKAKADREAAEKAKMDKISKLSKSDAKKLFESIGQQLVAKLDGCDEKRAKAGSWVICKLLLDGIKIDGITLELE